MMQLSVNKQKLSFDVLLTVEYVKHVVDIDVQKADTLLLSTDSNVSFTSPTAVCRYLARAAAVISPQTLIYGENILQQAEIDSWLEFSTLSLSCVKQFNEALAYLNQALAPAAYLVGHSISIADFAVWAVLHESSGFRDLLAENRVPVHVARYFSFLSAQPKFVSVAETWSMEKAAVNNRSSGVQSGQKDRKEEGKFVELPGAEMGKVVVRFPPEASGYLHIGHAKAALLNQYYQQAFKGKLIMRFDDTNPMKENAEFEKVILDDIALLGLKPDVYSYTSDHFDTLQSLCERMIRDGRAFADDTDPDTMKKEREERTDSKNRNNSVERNLEMWAEMKAGSVVGQNYCVRAKISMQLDNGCMRDPTMYRVRLETHIRTGDKYRVYPTYDFACPLVDSLEGVTHALRTTEYHDRDEQYYWFLRTLGMREPHLYEYSRLNLQNTVMSKRKLTWFVDQGLVEGWDDPRFPTVRGVMRRGMTVEGLKEFVIAQGSSRSVNMMDWDKIWAFNKKVIDPVVPRYTALADVIPVHVVDANEEVKQVQKHPKNADVGMKPVWYSSRVWIEKDDADHFTVGENVTFINWGNLIIRSIDKSADGRVSAVEASLNLNNKDYKKTQKITWLAEVDDVPLIPVVCVQFDHLITKPILGKDEDFKQFINNSSRIETRLTGDPELSQLQKGDIIQLQRRGFFICDSPYQPPRTNTENASFQHNEHLCRYTGRESPCILFNIPDGHAKEMPTAGSKHKPSAVKEALPASSNKPLSAKEAAQSKKGKAAEKSPAEESTKTITTGACHEADEKLIKEHIDAQGQKVREMKAAGASKEEVTAEVNMLLALKKHYKDVTGEDFVPAQQAKKPDTQQTEAAKKTDQKKKQDGDRKVGKSESSVTSEKEQKGGKGRADVNVSKESDADKDGSGAREVKKVTRLGLEVKKEENFSEWYSQVITKAEMIEYYDVSGCYVLRPWAFGIWERISDWFDTEIKKLGFENCYFPMFVSANALETEKDHIQDFAPEVAWVTKSGQTDLAQPIAIRPTSETVMYPSYAKWVQSHRDLPIKLNQWCSVVRWEFKHPQPFIRTREFLWQEGHSAHATYDEAAKEVLCILDLYEHIYEQLLAVPVVKGKKTMKEKFAGGEYTTTVEAYIAQSGRGIQAATSHHLGQNFSKMFDISFEDPETRQTCYAYQNSWGVTTRSIGIIVMVHGDNRGLVLPPRIAQIQIVLVPCGVTAQLDDKSKSSLLRYCESLVSQLRDSGLRVRGDYRDNYSPGWKFNHWELKGVPVRIELGPRDMEKGEFVAVRRDTLTKVVLSVNTAVDSVTQLLNDIHDNMYRKAHEQLSNNTATCYNFDDFCHCLDKSNIILAPFCGEIACEDKIKALSARDVVGEEGAPAMGAKALCIPFKQPAEIKSTDRCICPDCPHMPLMYTLFGRSY